MNHVHSRLSRRNLMRRAAGYAAAFTVMPRSVLGGAGHTAPSEKLQVAIIGTGGQGRTNLGALLPQDDVNIRAICDVTEEADYSQLQFRLRRPSG